MNIAVSGRPVRRVPDVMRGVLRRGTQLGHYCSSVVGFLAIGAALALWFQPSWRAAIAERVMPLLAHSLGQSSPNAGVFSSVDVHASDAAVLSVAASAPSTIAPTTLAGESSATKAGVSVLSGPVSVAGQPTIPGLSTAQMGPFGAPLDPNNLPSVVRLAQSVRIVADARYDRTTASSMRVQQSAASYIARRYHVAQEPIDTLVHAAFQTGRDVGIDPLLLLAVMAVESGFNPYAESGVGARGLMQVMPRIHSDKFEYYGGTKAALEPVPNLRVGALILKDYIGRTGSIAGGLRRYVGSTAIGDGGYGARVLAERTRLRDAIRGLPSAPAMPTVMAATPPLSTAGPVAADHPSATQTGHSGRVHGVIQSNGATVKASTDARVPENVTTASIGDA